jgi:hypothetical protein
MKILYSVYAILIILNRILETTFRFHDVASSESYIITTWHDSLRYHAQAFGSGILYGVIGVVLLHIILLPFIKIIKEEGRRKK